MRSSRVTENSSKILSRISASRWGAFVQFQATNTLIVEIFYLQSISDGIKRSYHTECSPNLLINVAQVHKRVLVA